MEPIHAAYDYANGIFYCVGSQGELGAFDVGLEKWSVLTNLEGLPDFNFNFVRLIVWDGNLQLIVGETSELANRALPCGANLINYCPNNKVMRYGGTTS
ncbi:F-box protein [Corchorus olitorius]|uniref:F-box protein n=1 Tax=Corchorus olitorius TaxID=93759 RepID=A0A1R3GI00_9ROSI|nr:F-box protein [Corchorus olitorius]